MNERSNSPPLSNIAVSALTNARYKKTAAAVEQEAKEDTLLGTKVGGAVRCRENYGYCRILE